MPDPLEIEIKIEKAGTGGEQAVETLRNMEQSTVKTGAATKELGKETGVLNEVQDQFGRRGGAAREAFEGIDRAARGGEASIFGLAKTWRALTEAMALNPFTAILVTLAALGPLLVDAAKWLFGAGESAKDLAEANKKAAEEMKKLNEEAERKGLEEWRDQLKETGEAAKILSDALDLVDKANAKIDAAKLKADRAQIRNDPTLTNEEKEKRLAALDQDAAAGTQAREIAAENRKAQEAQTVAARAAAYQAAAQAEVNRLAEQKRQNMVKANVLAESGVFDDDPLAQTARKLLDQTTAALAAAQKDLDDKTKQLATAQAKAAAATDAASENIFALQVAGLYDRNAAGSDSAAAIAKGRRQDIQAGGEGAEEFAREAEGILKTSPLGKTDPHLEALVSAIEKVSGETGRDGRQDQLVRLHQLVLDLVTQLKRDKADSARVDQLEQQLRALSTSG